MAKLEVRKNGNAVILSIKGRHTLHDKADFQAMLEDIKASGGSTLCVDVSAMEYVDSSGIGDLIKVKMESGKIFEQLLVYGMSEAVARSFRVSGLLQLFEIIDEAHFRTL
ncbi:MAG: STAS domain-containing protein [Leptospirales bacterium]|nr:STAS domain-containing protein [Leptospirales bacterium]